MFCLFSPSKCVDILQLCANTVQVTDKEKQKAQFQMHSSEAAPPQSGPLLLQQLGRLIVRARSPAHRTKNGPSTSQVQVQPRCEVESSAIDEELSTRAHALWTDMEPMCIEVLLVPECADSSIASFERGRHTSLLLERWTMTAVGYKVGESTPSLINAQWLLNAVRSQLHFSQLSAWIARLNTAPEPRRKLSREQCNYKKVEANCDDSDTGQRKLNIVYSVKTTNENAAEFARSPNDHTFPLTDIGNNKYLKITLQSLPRIDDIPKINCPCKKRRPSKDMSVQEELVGKLNDLSLGTRKYDGAINSNIGTPTRKLSIISNPGSIEYLFKEDKELVDDRMLTPCSENGKHKCCDDESDGREKQPTKKLDERRLKEIAKYKRRIRKEKMKHLCESTSSEDGKSRETTSIPILQAARFDRFKAIGFYRNQTYLTLPASRIETKSPFVEAEITPPPEYKKTNTVGTQTDFSCDCGNVLELKCESCNRGMSRSEANYNLASLSNGDKQEIGARRKLDDAIDEKAMKKHKCDNRIIDSVSSFSDLIKRPKLRRALPIMDRIGKIISDRDTEKDIKELHLNTDDSVFSVPKESKRQKTFSISDDDYVLYEKCDYGTIDNHEMDSPREEKSAPDFRFSTPLDNFDTQKKFVTNKEDFEKEEQKLSPNYKFSMPEERNIDLEKEKSSENGFVFPDPKRCHDNVPSPSEMDRFRWRFDSAASMVFHTKTGLPLTSSPAPLRRGNNCFDFDDSINGISGIKSALFHPPSPLAPLSPASPPAPRPVKKTPRIKIPPATGLLGSFEESALQGRLEAVATVHGFTAELGASGALCPPHKRLPVTVFFYAPGGTNAPYMGHINLGPAGYRVSRSGTIQVSLFNPHGTLVKMFVVLYDLSGMPACARTFLRQRTLYMPAGEPPPTPPANRWLRYLIHLRFMTSKSGKLYLHTDIRLIVSRKADLDTATAHSALYRPLANNDNNEEGRSPRAPNRVFGGSGEFADELGTEGVSYELRSFTYAPENPKYSPR